jgi:hypothetical protein
MCWACSLNWETGNVHGILVRKGFTKWPVGTLRREDNNAMGLKKIYCENGLRKECLSIISRGGLWCQQC